MNQDAREQARHISEVTKAYADGKEIQARVKNTRTWLPFDNFPEWDFPEVEYRVKPEERKPRIGKMWAHTESEELHCSHGHSSYDSARLAGWVLVSVVEVLPETETE